MTIRAAVFSFMDQHGEPCVLIVGYIEHVVIKYTKLDDVKRKHVMRCIRQYCDISGATIRRVGCGYRFTPCVKVENAIVD